MVPEPYVYVNVLGVVDDAPRFVTFTETVPAVAVECGNVPLIDVALVYVVGTGEPFTVTVEPARVVVGAKKAVPVQTTAALAAPAAMVAGVKVVSVGVYRPTISSDGDPDFPMTAAVFAGGVWFWPPAIVTTTPVFTAGELPLAGDPDVATGGP